MKNDNLKEEEARNYVKNESLRVGDMVKLPMNMGLNEEGSIAQVYAVNKHIVTFIKDNGVRFSLNKYDCSKVIVVEKNEESQEEQDMLDSITNMG